MTMPHERYLSVTSFSEMLAAAAADQTLDATLRERALALRERFPKEQALRELALSKRRGLPAAWADAFDDAILWLSDLRCKDVSEELGQWRRWTVRHFPQAWQIQAQRRAATESDSVLYSTIDRWIYPDDI